ncbi:hypothetical protein JAAARDRAFT_435761 [Jaapia argillacea MUCL 33604]|uniref:Uncharacterized protein n=1 Tax=Jaapia argillacea MUCL 33604 TaxID=933084 RepID=A0A067PS22_9AGAM|nr:hypothetical protein JAAARDRAFT_435761 [Jaapia argillacea MUCL 33604]
MWMGLYMFLGFTPLIRLELMLILIVIAKALLLLEGVAMVVEKSIGMHMFLCMRTRRNWMKIMWL